MTSRKTTSYVEFYGDVSLEDQLDHHTKYGKTQKTYDGILRLFIDYLRLPSDQVQLSKDDLEDEKIASFVGAEGLLFIIIIEFLKNNQIFYRNV